MKKKILSLCILPFLLPLTSCAKEVTGTCYYQDVSTTFAYGNLYLKTDVTAYNDKIQDLKIDATYSPSVWARVSASDATKLGEENVFTVNNVKQLDGSDAATTTFAKYIQIGSTVYEGHARTEDEEANYSSTGEVTVYSQIGFVGKDDQKADLARYFSTLPTDTYHLYPRIEEYYTAVTSGNIKILTASKTDKSSTATYAASDVKPAFPNNSPLLSGAGDKFAYFETGVASLKEFFSGKAINFNYLTPLFSDNREGTASENHALFKTIDGTWHYNTYQTEIDWNDASKVADVDNHWEDLKLSATAFSLNDVRAFFTSINNAFASVEYASVR